MTKTGTVSSWRLGQALSTADHTVISPAARLEIGRIIQICQLECPLNVENVQSRECLPSLWRRPLILTGPLISVRRIHISNNDRTQDRHEFKSSSLRRDNGPPHYQNACVLEMWSSIITTFAIVAVVSNAFPTHNSKLHSRTLDYCSQAYNESILTNTGYFPAGLALSCLQMQRYDPDIALPQIDSFNRTFKFYAPESYAIDSPNPNVPLDVNIPESLQTIKNGLVAGNYSFFEYEYALDTLVRSLNDGFLPPPHVWCFEILIGKDILITPILVFVRLSPVSHFPWSCCQRTDSKIHRFMYAVSVESN